MESLKEQASMKGRYFFTKRKLETAEHFALDREITALKAELLSVIFPPTEERAAELHRMINEKAAYLNSITKVTERVMVDNILPTVGRANIMNNAMSASPTNLMLVKYAELGSGTNAPANGDTTLQTSVYRNVIASCTNASNVGYATAFFSATETTGTYREAGIFMDGTASAGTGVLFSRVAINITKSSSETLTLDWQVTLS